MTQPARRGFSIIELMIVIAVISIIFFRIAPMISEIKARSALRAARQELSSTFSTARAAAMQKGRAATLTISSTAASVTVISSTTGNAVTLVGPIRFDKTYGTLLTALNSAPTTLQFDGRGLVTPASATISKYKISNSKWSDTVCVSGSGIVLPRGCAL